MGTAVSRSLDLSKNEYCLKFVSETPIPQNDPYWNRFLSFNIILPTTSNDQLYLENKLETLFQDLLKNNLKTGNICRLIELFLLKSSELLSATSTNDSVFNWQLFNGLFTIRCIIKFLTETVTEEQLIEHIEFGGNADTLESFIGALVGILVDVPITDSTYVIHLEAVTCLIILLSVQYHSNQRSEHSTIYRYIMKGKHIIHAPVLVKCLLMNFIAQQKPPPEWSGSQGQSLVIGLASEIWSVLTFSKKSEPQIVPDQVDFHETPLATQSLLLILVLVHHWTNSNNPYRQSLFSCTNQDNNPIQPTNSSTVFKIDLNSMYHTICKKTTGDTTTLLLYLMLHQNDSFQKYILARMDLEQLIIPILKTLYNAPNSNSHHIYMSLIILLILSEDESFNKMVHETKLKNITWYTERALAEITLGGLLILVVIRTVQYNMLKMRDQYLHTNCLAALANMSSQFRNLHPYVSQRLISLFETIAKKYQRLVTRLRDDQQTKTTEVAVTVNQDTVDLEQDVNVLEEVLRMLLEILNSCLSTQSNNNPNLIYTLLYKKHVFEQFKDTMVFQDIIHNINIIIDYFSTLLSEKSQHCEMDPPQVLAVIQQGARYWPKERITKFPDLKFKYVEEDQPEEFFIPYVWELVNQHSVLHWSNNSANSVSAAIC